jgi:2-C-methyl-D-erythritol 4-phosphate cytidylyltransferase
MTRATAMPDLQVPVHDPTQWSFLIPAAGQGLRFGRGPKLMFDLHGEMLWERAVRRARAMASEVVLAVPAEHFDGVGAGAAGCKVIVGGASRQETVSLALAACTRDNVLIHDVARPFASLRLMCRVAQSAREHGAAACQASLDGPLIHTSQGLLSAMPTLPAGAGMVHSPLAFRRDVLQQAYAAAATRQTEAASTVELVFAAGFPVRLVADESENIKITFPGDERVVLAMAKAWDAYEAQELDRTPASKR